MDALLKRHVNIVKIFGPEHGFLGTANAGATVSNDVYSSRKIPVISLYGKHFKPTPEDLADVDVMIYDAQDVGVRYYTDLASMQYFMEAAAENHKPFIILDRPNPIGLHRVTVREIDGYRLKVGPIEAIDGTPVVDIKPVLSQIADA